jgi:hypothetical protein
MLKKTFILIWMTVLAVGFLAAQSKTGTTVGAFLSIEPSARIAAMGNAGVTQYTEPEAVYYNPGAIGYMRGNGAQFTHSLWIADIGYDYGVFLLDLKDAGNVYATVTSLSSGEIDVRTVDFPLGTGEKYTVSDVAVGIGFGRQISEKFSVGAQVNYIQETIWHSALSAYSFSVGTIYRISEEGFHLGASISNFGTRGKYDGRDLRVKFDQNLLINGDNNQIPAQINTDEFPLPVIFRVGLGMPFIIDPDNKISVEVDAFHPSDNTESISFGGEYLFYNTFALRAGYQNLFQQDSEVGLTLGGGVQYDMVGYRFNFDYCWADQGRLKESHRLSVGLTF